MKAVLIALVLALVAASCTARSRFGSHYLDLNIDNVKKMILEYEPAVRDEVEKLKSAVPRENLSARQIYESIVRVENADDPIPAVATNLGLTDLVQFVVKAGLKDTLESAGPFTVFGPTNDAFANLPDWLKKEVANVTVLGEVLKYHVLAGKVESKSLANELQVPTVEGNKLRINLYTKEGKSVATAQCAPIDLTRVDQAASNGVIHVLNSVMIPPHGNIVATALACPAFKDLVKAVAVAGLAPTLAGPGPFTLFAPTDKAFAKLPPGTIEKLIHNPKELAKILEYHVVSGTFCSAGLSSGKVKTVNGAEVSINVSADGVVVNESKVIMADGSVTNGVIHAIDTVLLPPGYVLP